MKHTRVLLLSLAAVTLLVVGLGSFSFSADEVPSGTDGKTIFLASKCDMCHAVPAAGIEAKVKSEKMKGPDLTQAAGRFEPEDLAKYIRKQAPLEGKDHKKEFKGTDEELTAMITWLRQLKSEG